MRIPHHPPRRAFAVLIVLVAAMVLSILAAALAIFMKVESQLAQNSNDSEQLLWIGRAGVERACWILAQEPPGPTSLKQIWAGGSGDGPETNSPLMGISLSGFQVGGGTVDISMVEQESKFNINTADGELLHSVLNTMGAKPDEQSTVADSIQDWVGPGDAARPAGAKSDYYQGLSPSYNAKNAPIDDIQELQFIRGVTPNLYNGTSPGENGPFQHHKLGFGPAPGQPDELAFGLKDVFTPYSSGKVNINTAGANVLNCIPFMDTNIVGNIITFRTSEGDTLGDNGVIRNLGQLQGMVAIPAILQQLQRYCTVAGSTYEVTVKAHVGPNSREFVAVIIRNGNNQASVVRFYPK